MALVVCNFMVSGPLEPCPADLNGDGVVAVPDLLELLAAWGAGRRSNGK